MAKEIHPEIKKFLSKVGYSAAGGADVGMFAGMNNVQHPIAGPLLGGLIGAATGAVGAVVHQRGIAVGQQKAHEALRKEQFGK